MDSHIVIAESMTEDEALSLLVEPAVATLIDLDDFTITVTRVTCTSDGNAVVCWVPREVAARIGGHRVSLECHDGDPGVGARWLVSIRGRADRPIDHGAATPEVGAPAGDLVEVRVTPASMRGCRFVPVRPVARKNAPHLLGSTS